MKTIHVLVAAFCLLGFNAFAQKEVDPFAEPDPSEVRENPRLIRTQVEYVEMSHKDLTRLMMEDKNMTADATSLRMKVQAMVEKEEAKIIDTQIVLGRSGGKQTTESIHEFIYPTEYEPMNCLPTKKKKQPVMPDVSFPYNPATPTAFETRNVGSTLEAEPTLGEDDRIIDISVYPDLIWHTGNTVWNERKDELGNLTKITMPDFYKVSLNTSFTCIAGQYTMAGVVSPKDAKGEVDQDRKVMIFVKCDVLEVK
jgi:hypothetical protein